MYTKHIPVKVVCVKQLFQDAVICKSSLWSKEYSREMCAMLEVYTLVYVLRLHKNHPAASTLYLTVCFYRDLRAK